MPVPRIKTITIRDFKGFPEDHVDPIEINGENVLLYGENGSGKTTIYTALCELLDKKSTRVFDDNVSSISCLKHLFSKPKIDKGLVKLDFTVADNASAAEPPMEWRIKDSKYEDGLISNGERPEQHDYYKYMSQYSSFLDYRRILSTHFLHYDNDSINLFSLVVGTLLRDIKMPTRQVSFGEEWSTLQKQKDNFAKIITTDKASVDPYNSSYLRVADDLGFDPREFMDEDEHDVGEDNDLEIDVARAFDLFEETNRGEFKSNAEQLVEQIQQQLVIVQDIVNEYLKHFDPLLRLHVDPSEISIPTDDDTIKKADWDEKANLPIRVKFRGEVIRHPGIFLNEARLTAIALTLYLAILKIQREAVGKLDAPCLLVLDDVLIGLDMAHRLPILSLIREEFATKGWQVFLFTFDKEWYEIAKQRLTNGWKRYELYSVRVGSYEQPLLKTDNDHIYRALEFLESCEVKAAVVHVRTQFELVLKKACIGFKCLIEYREEADSYSAGDFWEIIRGYKWHYLPTHEVRLDGHGKIVIWEQAPKLEKIVNLPLEERITHSLSRIYNPLSHSQNIKSYRVEVYDAVYAVDELEREIVLALKRHKKPNPSEHSTFIKSLGFLQTVLTAVIEKKKASGR